MLSFIWLEKKTLHNRKLMLATICCVTFIMVTFGIPMAASNQQPTDRDQSINNVKRSISHTGQPQPENKYMAKEQGDIYCRAEEYTYTIESGVQTGSTLNQVTDMWIGDQKIAHIRNGKKIVIDLEKNKLYFVNHNTETYLETQIPVNLESIISEEIKPWFYRNRKEFTQRIEEIDETKQIMGKECQAYELTRWRTDQSAQGTIKVWATTDVSFGLDAYYILNESLRKFYNMDETGQEETKKIKGFQLRYETEAGEFSKKWRTIENVVELARKKAPEEIYSFPEGYQKKEYLTWQDF